ncbi:hypothetical protein V5E97_25870 [Singulisphaera sp. Ch08]|uniref:N-acetyltransferase domain-containing protein n=1 Tax=Singulisphaera sp. Ch08 TaxID=3120278 RepID=A0AAU7C9G1_9BACT
MAHIKPDFKSTPGPTSIEIRRCLGLDWLPELIDLRRLVWEQETGLLSEEKLVDDNDRQGVHFLVYDSTNNNRLVASTCAVLAERSNFAAHTRLPEKVLRETMVSTRSTVHPDYRGNGLFSLLVYLAGREGRMQERRWLAAYMEPGMAAGRKVSGARNLEKVASRRVEGRDGSYEVVTIAEDVNYVMSNSFRRIPEHLHPYLRETFFVDEVVGEVMSGARRFYEGPWFKAVENGELTRRQYITTLAEMHTYVRWTTRLLGTVIGITSDPELRKHYLRHLGGEIDHEVMLENDIDQLGFDVDYIKNHHSPSEHIRTFMSLQESLSFGPRRDPSLFLAAPFAAEALSAFLKKEFVEKLSRNIASWGVDNPSRAMTFITSHADFDGGTDGHWEAMRRILHRHLKGERELREFLSIVRLAQNSLLRAFSSFVEGTDIFAASPLES